MLLFRTPAAMLCEVNWPESCAIVIPCFNEARQIGALVKQCRAYLPKVLVVDDGSDDRTADEARSAGAQVLLHSSNKGKGVALASGLAMAQQSGFAWAVTMDGDGQHAATDIPKFLQCAERSEATLVIGNRMDDARHMPPLRRFVNYWMSRRISTRAGVALPDTQCGFRLINLDVWSRLEFCTRRFEVESEILLAFVQAQQRIEAVPIEVIYKTEQSKIRPLSDTLRWLWWWHWTSRTARSRSAAIFDADFARLQENSRPAID
jgi:glycosyltransferase involved in cell wall biosynthesis